MEAKSALDRGDRPLLGGRTLAAAVAYEKL